MTVPTETTSKPVIEAATQVNEPINEPFWHNARDFLIHRRRELALICSSLAIGTLLGEAEQSQAQPVKNSSSQEITANQPTYGLSGLNLTLSDFNITTQPDWNLIAGPSSPYPTQWVRAGVHPSDIKGSDTIIKANLSYAKRFLGYHAGNKQAPVEVSFAITNQDLATTYGVDHCDRKLDHKFNRLYNLPLCLKETNWIATSNEKKILRQFPQIKYETAQNEPEDGGLPTNISEGGPKEAVRLWLITSKIAETLHNNQTIIAGEFQNIPSQYEAAYERDIVGLTKKEHLPLPSAWAIHPYEDIVCADETHTLGFLKDLHHFGLYQAVKSGSGIWVNEAAAKLQNNDSCSNGELLANDFHQPPANLSAENLTFMSIAQILSGRTFMQLYKVDPQLKFHLFYYGPDPGSPRCWGGGNWDSGLWAPDGKWRKWLFTTPSGEGIPGNKRPILYALTRQPVPRVLLHPKSKRQLIIDKLTNVAPINFGKLNGNCQYGNVLSNQTGPPTPNIRFNLTTN